VSGCKRDEFLGFGERGSERLFDQHVDAGGHQVARYGKMMHGGRGDGSGLHFAVRSKQLIDRAEPLATELAGDGVGAIHVRIYYSEQADGFALLFEFFVDAGVVASEDACAHYHDGSRSLRWQGKISMAGCRKEIVNGNDIKSIWIASLGCELRETRVFARPCANLKRHFNKKGFTAA